MMERLELLKLKNAVVVKKWDLVFLALQVVTLLPITVNEEVF
jgi:hypothetical protein